jgi:hypothetical protein
LAKHRDSSDTVIVHQVDDPHFSSNLGLVPTIAPADAHILILGSKPNQPLVRHAFPRAPLEPFLLALSRSFARHISIPTSGAAHSNRILLRDRWTLAPIRSLPFRDCPLIMAFKLSSLLNPAPSKSTTPNRESSGDERDERSMSPSDVCFENTAPSSEGLVVANVLAALSTAPPPPDIPPFQPASPPRKRAAASNRRKKALPPSHQLTPSTTPQTLPSNMTIQRTKSRPALPRNSHR